MGNINTTQTLLVWPHHSIQHHCKNNPARHPGGKETTPWMERDDTLEGKRRHPGGKETTPWREIDDGTAREKMDTQYTTINTSGSTETADDILVCEWHLYGRPGKGMKVKMKVNFN